MSQERISRRGPPEELGDSMKRALICGSRDFDDVFLLTDILDKLDETMAFDVIIEGEAAGVDSMARSWAEARGLPVEKYPADWGKYGKSAGPRRNRQMLYEGKPDIVIAFVNKPIIQSRGTYNMISNARMEKVRTIVIEVV